MYCISAGISAAVNAANKPKHIKSAYDYLDEALRKNHYSRSDIPDLVNTKQWKYAWCEGEYTIEVRIHKGNPLYTDAKYIFRVSKNNKFYLDVNGFWYSVADLKKNDLAAKATHILIGG